MSEVFSYVKPPAASASPDMLPSGSADIGEAGTLSGHSGQPAPQVKAEGIYPPASQQAPQGCAEGSHPWRNPPNVYTSAQTRSACRCIRSAAAKPPYYLRLTDREFLHAYHAVEHDRSKTRKAIGKGLAEPGDLRATDSLWQVLQDVMTRRMKGYRL